MIKIKHFMEAEEEDDGARFWVEPIGLTRDLRQWCHVDEMLSAIGPPSELWEWFNQHPRGYEYFRGAYHESLTRGPYRGLLRYLAGAAGSDTINLTLLHQGVNDQQNTATALYEYLSELSVYESDL